MVPKVTPVGVPMVRTTVSFDSTVVSPTTLKLALPVKLLAAIVITVGAPLKSAAVAVPV